MSKGQEFESAASPGDVTEAPGTASDESDPKAGPASGSGTDNGAGPVNGQASAPGDEAVDPASGRDTDAEAESDGTPEEAPEEEQAKLAEEVLHYKDRWVRLAAEFDNYKKRTGREFSALVKNAGESLITELLPILDNIDRALQAPQTSDETRSFAQGFEMIRQQFLEKLERAGMKEIMAEGETFDPTRHEAVMAVENGDQPADTVVNVVEKGYTLNEKVLRAAKVIVTRPPAKAQNHDDTGKRGPTEDG